MVRHLLKAKAATDAGEDKFGRSPLSVAILENRKDAFLRNSLPSRRCGKM